MKELKPSRYYEQPALVAKALAGLGLPTDMAEHVHELMAAAEEYGYDAPIALMKLLAKWAGAKVLQKNALVWIVPSGGRRKDTHVFAYDHDSGQFLLGSELSGPTGGV